MHLKPVHNWFAWAPKIGFPSHFSTHVNQMNWNNQTIGLLPSQIINPFRQKIALNYKSFYTTNETLNVIFLILPTTMYYFNSLIYLSYTINKG